jgi:hypothetical protein
MVHAGWEPLVKVKSATGWTTNWVMVASGAMDAGPCRWIGALAQDLRRFQKPSAL